MPLPATQTRFTKQLPSLIEKLAFSHEIRDVRQSHGALASPPSVPQTRQRQQQQRSRNTDHNHSRQARSRCRVEERIRFGQFGSVAVSAVPHGQKIRVTRSGFGNLSHVPLGSSESKQCPSSTRCNAQLG